MTAASVHGPGKGDRPRPDANKIREVLPRSEPATNGMRMISPGFVFGLLLSSVGSRLRRPPGPRRGRRQRTGAPAIRSRAGAEFGHHAPDIAS